VSGVQSCALPIFLNSIIFAVKVYCSLFCNNPNSEPASEAFVTCGEFAICKKPVITYGLAPENEHLLILKEKAVIYNNEKELFDIINTFDKNKYDMNDNGYMFYTPKNVMNIFNSVFLER
jgi:hypothetical protein